MVFMYMQKNFMHTIVLPLWLYIFCLFFIHFFNNFYCISLTIFYFIFLLSTTFYLKKYSIKKKKRNITVLRDAYYWSVAYSLKTLELNTQYIYLDETS